MRVQILVLLVLAITCTQGLLIPHVGKLTASKPPKFRLDLNVPAYHRWDNIAPTFKGPLTRFVHAVIDRLPLSQSFYQNFGQFAESQPIYTEFVEEMKGIANVLDVQWEKILLANFIYEISTVIELDACSSILAFDKNNKIVHGRNLDFWPWALMSKDSAVIEVYRGDQYVATLGQIIGSVFALSGISNNDFSVTVDTRYWKDSFSKIIDNIIVNKYIPSAWLVRMVLQDAKNYQEAVNTLKDTNVSSPIYYTVGGIDQGVIIEKQPEGYRGLWELNTNSDEWFLVVTNYDREDGDPTADDRKTPATKRLEKLGQDNVTPDSIFKIMKQYPTLNIASIYTTIYQPSTGYNDVTLWYGNVDDYQEKNQEKGFLNKQEDPLDHEDLIVEDAYYSYMVNSQFPQKYEQGIMFAYAEKLLKKELKSIEE